MKHIFYIHSFTLYIASLSVISEEQICEKDVLFLYGRKFSGSERTDIPVVLLSDGQEALAKIPTYGERFLIFKRLRVINEIDQLFNKFVKDDQFIAYLPSTKNYLMQLIATHPHCHHLAFIDEGLLSYTPDFYKKTNPSYSRNWLGVFKRWIKFSNHLNRSYYYRPYYNDTLIPVYVFADGSDALPSGFDVRILSNIVSPSIDSEYILENAHILFMQNIVELGAASLQSLLAVIDILISYLTAQGVKLLWIKFHPAQEIESAVIDYLNKSEFPYKVIPKNVSAEAILLNSKGLHTYGVSSSLLFYAACWGHQSYSLSKLLEEIDPLFQSLLVTGPWYNPGVFYKKVPFLEAIKIDGLLD